MRRYWRTCVLGVAIAALPACSMYNRTLFVTKTNVGFEASSTPPAFELDIARLEGVLAPQFENGKKLPVMASFKFKNSGAFAPAVGSAFATGDAATTMAALYGDRTPMGDWQARAGLVSGKNGAVLPTDSTLRLEREPKIEVPFPLNLFGSPTFQKEDVRPVFFGTDTSLGLKIAWSGMTGTMPDSARLGYHRKELAFVPIAVRQRSGTAPDGRTTKTYDVKMTSLMATVDSGVEGLKNPDGTPALDYQHLQYFATGDAATLLAMQQDVRMAMLARLDPNKELQKARFRLSERGKAVAFVLLNPIYAQLREEEKANALARTLADRMDSLEPPGLAYDFKRYQYANANVTDTVAFPALSGRPFERLHSYYTNLSLAIVHLENALTDDKLGQFNGVAIGDKTAFRKQLYALLTELKQKRANIEQRVYSDPTVTADAVEYFYR